MDKEKTCNLLRHTENLKFKLIFESAIIGAIVGLTIVLHRVLLDKLSGLFLKLYTHSKGNLLDTIVLFGLLIISGYIVAIMVKKVPMISGSGIPQVEGILMKKLKGNWLSILVNKFLGGLLALGAGLSLGREGPSVQMGASIGEGFAKIFKRVSIEEKYLITSGASAGLAAAFNAPISGVMFALEEVHKNFSPLVLLSVMSSALMSDFVTKNLLGIGKSLNFVGVKVLDLKYYWLLIILGAIVGISGVIFNSGILKTQAMFKKSKLSTEIKVIIPFLITGVVGLLSPVLLGGGHGLIMSLGKGSITLKMLLLFLLVKYLLTFVGFGSGIPGGIFFPLLVLGALIGNIFGIVAIDIFDIPSVYMFNFIILAMAANFAAIVKAPITGIILICEMTGSFEHLLSLAIVCVVAYITSDLLKSEPIYESLLERCLQSGNDKFETNISRKSLMEIVVHIGSEVENKKIKEIKWPANCLIVSIARGGKEIIPCGDTVLLSGDYLTVMADEENVACALDCITDLTSNIKLL